METQIDFLQRLKPVMALKILAYLDDSADLIRASAVSRHWHNIVVSNGLSKQLCIKKFPQLSSITRVDEVSHNNSELSHSSGDREHRVYASLFHALTAFPETFCIAAPVSASSTDNYPDESIMNTLDLRDEILYRPSYWSSKGSDDSETPETLIYKLKANVCAIIEIYLHPFQAYFQLDFPIYSSKSVRFRMGHPKSWNELDHDFMEAQECADDKFIWTYTSPIFPVAQENRLQRFKLPEPAVCIGGFLQVQLLGRVQEQALDGKYYICVAHVQAVGHQLSPAFSVEFSEPPNSVSLKYDAKEFGLTMRNVSRGHDFSQNMETQIDFLQRLKLVMALKILAYLDDSADLIRASAVSRHWHNIAYFQLDFPIYSSKSVRFRMGHPKSWNELDHDFMAAQECADEMFIWTYTSPIFPVAQENRLQRFKLPEPAVCIGGFLQVELLGRVQEQVVDGKYYICVAHVQAIGRQLSPAFSVAFSEPSNSAPLKFDAEEFGLTMRNVSRGHDGSLVGLVHKFSTISIS